ncbi:MAG: MFS transporter [Spirochaetaceae bacterium]
MKNRNLWFLIATQCFFMSANMMFTTLAPMLGKSLLINVSYATLPMAMSMLSMLIFSFPVSIWMGKKGRGPAFKTGLLSNMLAAVIFFIALQSNQFYLLLIGSVFFGFSISTANFYRFAAMELVPEKDQSKAISMVMSVGIVAALVGPNLGSVTKNLIFDIDFSASVLTFIPLSLMSLIMVSNVKWPAIKELKKENDDITTLIAPLDIWKSGTWKPIFGAMVSFGIMVLIMSATPLHMSASKYAFSDTAWVIQWHVLGMFAPSFFLGWIIKKIGLNRLLILGVIFLILSIAVNLISDSRALLTIGLLFLGIGWNFLFLGSSKWLMNCIIHLNVKERSRVQGINEVLVYGLSSAATLSSGWIINKLGWQVLNIVALPILILLLGVLILNTLKTKKLIL